MSFCFTVLLCTVRYWCWRRAGVSCSCCVLYSGACPFVLLLYCTALYCRYCCWRRAGVSCSCCALYSGACPFVLLLYCTALYCQVLLLEESWCELFLLCSVQWSLSLCPYALLHCSVLSVLLLEESWCELFLLCSVQWSLPLCPYALLHCSVLSGTAAGGELV